MTLLVWLEKLGRWLGWSTILNLGLLLLALISTAAGLAANTRDLDTGLALTTVILGLGLGWAFAAAHPLPTWLSLTLLTLLGVEALLVRIGRLEAALLDLGLALVNFGWQLTQRPLTGGTAFDPISPKAAELWVQLNTLLDRLVAWSLSLTTSEPTFDPVAAALVWSLSLWLVAAWAGWAVRRWGRPLLGLTPAGLLLATTLAYRPQDALRLAPLLTSILLLMGFTKHQARERSWQARRIDYPGELLVDLSIAVIPLTALIVTLALVTPSISIRQITEFFSEQADLGEPLAQSLGVDPQRPGQNGKLQAFRAPGLPRRHLLGSGPELSRQVALLIQAELPQTGHNAETAVTRLPQRPRYYWRSLTYDRYHSRGWSTLPTRLLSYAPGERTLATLPPHRQLLRQTVQTLSDQSGRLYAAGDMVTAAQEFEIEWRSPADAFGAIIAADTYRVDSLVSTATAGDLSTAGSNYPDWLARRYLNLPPDVPDRVLQLARDLTATAPTPYDRAKAIEAYLRQFPYSLDLPEPPSERDMVDYFLFELQQGYCDYYATAMVVLARAAGLPARLAVGYAGGRYNAASQQYLITEAEAHSWPEIYFPNYGWIGFEPTAAQPVEEPALTSGPTPALPPALPPPGHLQPTFWQLLDWLASVLVLLGLATVGVAAWIMTGGWRLRRLSPTETIKRLYGQLEQYSRSLAVQSDSSSTPLELTSALSRRVQQIAHAQPWHDRLQPVTQEAIWLTHLYLRTVYSPHTPNRADQVRAIQVWQRLQQRLWLAWLSALWLKLRQWICGNS